MYNQWRSQLSPNETKIAEHELIQEDTLVDTLNKLFRDSHDEIFEDGMDSVFGASIHRIVLSHGNPAIRALGKVIQENRTDEAVEEALRQIGRIKNANTQQQRRTLLERELLSSDSHIRDAALIGIEFMDDPMVIPGLQRALADEKFEPLRQNIKAVLDQLQNT